MVSRTERTPFGEWWWTVDRADAGGAVRPRCSAASSCRWPRARRSRRGSISTPFHFVNRHILFLVADRRRAARRPRFCRRAQIRRVALVVFLDQPAAGRGDAVLRRRDQGRAALARDLRRQRAAVGVPQAGLRHPDRLAVRRIDAAAGDAGQHRRAGAAADRGRAAGDAARLRPDHADRAGLGRAVLHGRHAADLGRRPCAASPALGLVGAYFTVPHVAQRIQRFMDHGSGDTFNIDLALESFVRGGWFGRGPGEGTVKRILPESHTDFVFAVGGGGIRHRALPRCCWRCSPSS